MAGRNLTADDLTMLVTKDELEGRATVGDLRAVESRLNTFATNDSTIDFVSRAELASALGYYAKHEFLTKYIDQALPLGIRAEMDRRLARKVAVVKKTAMWVGLAIGSVVGYEFFRFWTLAILHGFRGN